jgi:hypothetical protein
MEDGASIPDRAIFVCFPTRPEEIYGQTRLVPIAYLEGNVVKT